MHDAVCEIARQSGVTFGISLLPFIFWPPCLVEGATFAHFGDAAPRTKEVPVLRDVYKDMSSRFLRPPSVPSDPVCFSTVCIFSKHLTEKGLLIRSPLSDSSRRPVRRSLSADLWTPGLDVGDGCITLFSCQDTHSMCMGAIELTTRTLRAPARTCLISMVNLAPDVKPRLPGRHPLLPRQRAAGLSPVTGSFLPQQP